MRAPGKLGVFHHVPERDIGLEHDIEYHVQPQRLYHLTSPFFIQDIKAPRPYTLNFVNEQPNGQTTVSHTIKGSQEKRARQICRALLLLTRRSHQPWRSASEHALVPRRDASGRDGRGHCRGRGS